MHSEKKESSHYLLLISRSLCGGTAPVRLRELPALFLFIKWIRWLLTQFFMIKECLRCSACVNIYNNLSKISMDQSCFEGTCSDAF